VLVDVAERKHSLTDSNTHLSDLIASFLQSIFYPANMQTPGFDEENRLKPEVTRIIEDAGNSAPPEQVLFFFCFLLLFFEPKNGGCSSSFVRSGSKIWFYVRV
jgi:hypothetical protein